jgi:protein-tyrosine phosphatase
MKILFVCMGNICRSPTAEGVFRAYARLHAPALDIEIDSAGTHAYHIGEPPDPRTIAAAARRGVDLSDLRARQVRDDDFERFDLIVPMDRLNHATYGDAKGFDDVLDLVESAAEGLLAEVRHRSGVR